MILILSLGIMYDGSIILFLRPFFRPRVDDDNFQYFFAEVEGKRKNGERNGARPRAEIDSTMDGAQRGEGGII
jgi:hypothetical protein